MINYFILCDLFENFRKSMQQTEKESFMLLEDMTIIGEFSLKVEHPSNN